jgi:hypothetical protein
LGNYFLIPIIGAKGAAFSTAVAYFFYFLLGTLFSRKLWYRFRLEKYLVNFVLLLILVFIIEINMSKVIEVGIVCVIITVNVFFIKRQYTLCYGHNGPDIVFGDNEVL